jgi:predicted peptidase
MKNIFLFLFLFSNAAFGFPDSTNNAARQTTHYLLKEGTDSVLIGYLVYLPKEYDTSKENWPLIFFLHGIGERGSCPDTLRRHGLPKLIQKGKELPFIVISPQCPLDTYWPLHLEQLITLIRSVKKEYRIDTTRMYLTGLSMGGLGTWLMAENYPDIFAAIAPLCGRGDTIKAAVLKDLPIWAFHGAKDTLVLPQRSMEMKKLVEKAGGEVKLTIYPELGHSIWRETYNNPELFEWFLQHKRK